MDDFAHIVGEDVHFRGRSPSGERGLKYRLPAVQVAVHQSLPIRGAWIEIMLKSSLTLPVSGRSPSGERGLKSGHHQRDQRPDRRRSPSGERGLKYHQTPLRHRQSSRSPSGERGLKYICWAHLWPTGGRSPSGERGLKYCVALLR